MSTLSVDANSHGTSGAPGPRFHVEPSGILDGWYAIHDAATGLMAKSKRRVIFRTRKEADELAERLNRELRRRVIASVCRHRALAVEVVDGKCGKCRDS